jgi:hypothetical protein
MTRPRRSGHAAVSVRTVPVISLLGLAAVAFTGFHRGRVPFDRQSSWLSTRANTDRRSGGSREFLARTGRACWLPAVAWSAAGRARCAR